MFQALEMFELQSRDFVCFIIGVILGIALAYLMNKKDTYTPSQSEQLPDAPKLKEADQAQASPTDDLVKKLNEKGCVMFGSETCPHCKRQMAEFGPSFSGVHFMSSDDPKNAEMMKELKIQGVPSWRCKDGSGIDGYAPLGEIAQRLGLGGG